MFCDFPYLGPASSIQYSTSLQFHMLGFSLGRLRRKPLILLMVQKSATSWRKGTWNPIIIYKVLKTSQLVISGFLNHQQHFKFCPIPSRGPGRIPPALPLAAFPLHRCAAGTRSARGDAGCIFPSFKPSYRGLEANRTRMLLGRGSSQWMFWVKITPFLMAEHKRVTGVE